MTVIVRNAHANIVKGFLRVEIDKWAKIDASNEPLKNEVNLGNDLSKVEYELVSLNK